MATPQSISELTGNKYNELRYNSSGTPITGSFVNQVCEMLNKCGIDINSTNVYNDTVEKAVLEFQDKAAIPMTGILSNDTWKSMIDFSEHMSNIVDNKEQLTEETSSEESDSPHYNSFFDSEKNKTHRKNHKDIVIQFGNKSITKTIKDVFMRSVTVEVDTSGNPIFEIYEFIARDIKESDEASDASRYTSDQDSSASSDIQYNFNFVKPTTPEKRATPDEGVGGGGGGGSANSW